MPYVNNLGVKIHYEVEGHGPPLVLQHGLTSSIRRWRLCGYVEQLSNDYSLILVDARGHGDSEKPHNPQAYSARAIQHASFFSVPGLEHAETFEHSELVLPHAKKFLSNVVAGC